MGEQVPTFYGRELTGRERVIRRSLLEMKHGETMNRRSGVKVSRANWGGWFYVENGSGYRCEIGSSLEAAVHIASLEAA